LKREAAEVIASRYNLRMEDRILASKSRLQGRLASLSFSEKVKILERLRDREESIAAAGLRTVEGTKSKPRKEGCSPNLRGALV
jgi:hypothetical protein